MAERAIIRAYEGQSDSVPHVSAEDVMALVAAAESTARTPQQVHRDGLIIATMFDGCLRVSEAWASLPIDASHLLSARWKRDGNSVVKLQ